MNELDARRGLLGDPRRLSPQLQAEVDRTPRLAAFRDELLRTDDEMNRLLTRAEVPSGLADRIVLRARYRDRSRWGLALAATVVAVAIAVPAYWGTRGTAFEREMLEHVVASADELRHDGGVEPAVLRASVATLGVEVRDAGYRIRHLANCIVAGREGRHFTVDGPNGVVSFVVLPGVSGGNAELMQLGGMSGVFMKRSGATIGVFAQGATDRAKLEKVMQQVIA